MKITASVNFMSTVKKKKAPVHAVPGPLIKL
jgi:hypothetical protein